MRNGLPDFKRNHLAKPTTHSSVVRHGRNERSAYSACSKAVSLFLKKPGRKTWENFLKMNSLFAAQNPSQALLNLKAVKAELEKRGINELDLK